MSDERSRTVTLPPSVRVRTRAGGLTSVEVDGRAGTAEVVVQGAHVVRWSPVGLDPVLWMSDASRYRAGEPLRGGVPICFPWFGAHATDLDAAAHGFARRVDWELVDAHESGDDVVLAFVLTDTEATRASAWSHRFIARYTMTVGARLTLALEVTNLDEVEVTFEEALHTYLAVDDVRSTTVAGLEGADFVDKVVRPVPRAGEPGPVSFTAETDRVYPHTTATTAVRDGRREVTIAKQGSASTVVWNPWVAKAAAMPDFGDDEWPGMVCVETANVGVDAVHLAPGDSHTMVALFTVT